MDPPTKQWRAGPNQTRTDRSWEGVVDHEYLNSHEHCIPFSVYHVRSEQFSLAECKKKDAPKPVKRVYTSQNNEYPCLCRGKNGILPLSIKRVTNIRDCHSAVRPVTTTTRRHTGEPVHVCQICVFSELRTETSGSVKPRSWKGLSRTRRRLLQPADSDLARWRVTALTTRGKKSGEDVELKSFHR